MNLKKEMNGLDYYFRDLDFYKSLVLGSCNVIIHNGDYNYFDRKW